MNENKKSLLDNLLKQISEIVFNIEQERNELHEQTELLWKALEDRLQDKEKRAEALADDESCTIAGDLQQESCGGKPKKVSIRKRKNRRQTRLAWNTLEDDLNLFWKKHKSHELIGKLYEQYVGSMYERKGFEVDYNGIRSGLEDRGRDLICIKGKRIVIVQCKHWSKNIQIHEKHIFQLLGTTIAYRLNSPYKDKKVYPVFVTSTCLSNVAKEYAERFHEEYHMVIRENFGIKQVIKCKITAKGESIFYVPFDEEYFDIKINLQNEDMYCETVEEAKTAGFRYAYAYRYEQKGD